MKAILRTLALAFLIVGIVSVLPVQTEPQPTQAQQQSNPCPDGSYNIGTKDGINPICKLEPTGCPYGDSIPLGPDCDKHAPQPIETVIPAQPTEAAQCGGK